MCEKCRHKHILGNLCDCDCHKVWYERKNALDNNEVQNENN